MYSMNTYYLVAFISCVKMKSRFSIFITSIFCVVSNESVQPITRTQSLKSRTNLVAPNTGDSCEANGYKILHDFYFPDVTYPTSVLETCQPFYFNSNSNGLDAIVGPFSSDVKSNYRSLLSSNENTIKDIATKKSVLKNDKSLTHPIVTEDDGKMKNESIETKNEVIEVSKVYDSELEEILSILYSGETNAKDLDIDEYLKNHNIDEQIPESINEETTHSPNLNDTNIEENIPESMGKHIDNNLNSKDNSSITENILEPINEEIDDQLDLNNSTIDEKALEHIIEEYIDNNLNLTSSHIDENLSEPVIEDVHEYSELNSSNINENISEPINENIDTNADEKVPEPTDSNLNNYEDHQNVDSSINDDINQLLNLNNSNTDDNVPELINVDEDIKIIPKEAVVFDVVYKDGYNLEKPMLDIVPSNIPVRLKINIEICKDDSIVKDDLYTTKINEELQTSTPIENKIDLDDSKNSIENEDEESTPEEQITVLDEINESDFISALSILLLDSLNNKPIEIISPEIINAESNSTLSLSDLPLESSDKELDKEYENLTNNLKSETEENDPITVPEFIEQPTEYTNPNIVKQINMSPLIDVLMSSIVTDELEETANMNNSSGESNVLSIESDIKEYENRTKAELVETCPLLSLLSAEDKNTAKSSQEILSTKDFSSQKTSKENSKENSREYELPKPDLVDTCPLIDVFQLNIRESPVKDISEEKVEHCFDR